MKSATLLQLLAGTVSLTAAKPCKKLAPFPSGGFHVTKFDDALTAAANDPGFHEYITSLTKLFDVQPGKSYKLTPEGTLAETKNATDKGTGLVITHDGTVPKLVIGGAPGITLNVTLGLGLNLTLPSLGLPLPSGGSYSLNPLPLPTLSLPPLLPPFGASPTAGFPHGGHGNGTIASSTSTSAAVSSTASADPSSTTSSAAGTTPSSAITSSAITSSTASAVASAHPSSTSSAAAKPTAAAGCTSPETFIEWRSMKEADKTSYVKAVRCLMDLPATGVAGTSATNRYEELVWAHQTQSDNIHMSGIFLPWHRYYTNVYHRLLREECAYTAPMPWWDETKDAGNFAASGLFTAEYYGEMPEVTAAGLGTCITEGAFAGKALHIGPAKTDTTHCLSRGEDKSSTENVNTAYVNTCLSRTAYDDLRTCIEGGPHAYGHNGAGPVMMDSIASPSDPLFFLHHSFIDWTWKSWQDKSAAARATTISGCADQASPCAALTVDTKLSTRGVQADVTVKDILDTEGGFLCYKFDY